MQRGESTPSAYSKKAAINRFSLLATPDSHCNPSTRYRRRQHTISQTNTESERLKANNIIPIMAAKEDSVEYDLESPKSIDLASPSRQEDDISVATHQSDSESDSDSAHYDTRRASSYRKLLFVAVLAAVVGLTVGLGVGLTVGGEEARSVAPASNREGSVSENVVPVTNEPDTNVENESKADEAEPVEVKVDEEEAEPVLDTPEVEDKPPAFSGVVGMGNSFQNISWPQLVGLPAEEAKQIIEDEDAGYTVIIVPPGGATTKDLRDDRVFLFANEEGHVARVPRPGR